MTAKDACTISFHATAAGAKGVADLALRESSTHHSEHLRSAIGTDAKNSFFTTKVPMWDSTTEERRWVDVPFNVPHDQFASAVAQNPEEYDVSKLPKADIPTMSAEHP
eukprot:8922077-Pyramimonas_sp.AAC.1